jgi:hypothetical protein
MYIHVTGKLAKLKETPAIKVFSEGTAFFCALSVRCALSVHIVCIFHILEETCVVKVHRRCTVGTP